MIIRKAMFLAVAAASVASLSACGDRKEAGSAATVGDEAPALDAQAADAALAMITQDLNAPLVEVQGLLVRAVEDGDIRPHELMMYTPEGSLPIDWWVWNKGLVRLAEQPGYGPYLTLSDKGSRFVRFDAAAWLKPGLVGVPRMQCRSAGSATSAACTAEVSYTTVAGPGAEVGTVSLPQADAFLEAAFSPGQGWSITRISTEGATPSGTVRAALFGAPEDQSVAREQYETALASALERLQAEASPPAAAPKTQSEATASAPATDASRPSVATTDRPTVITSASYARQATNDELMSVYPARALDAGIAGRATISCTAQVNGRLGECESVAETPPGYRFGQAAVAAAQFFRVNPRTEDGRPVSSRITFSIVWTL
ncbi:energy transducer TonB [Roseibacterium beibuensis]|uniref:energy transducer TonB n=1 Tax=[Roseibacterium] beibuensis TaxID=1193142 RepID=UPI00217E161F|nr:energy transducer TonB [Roseibacterium beibuensis]MCS6627837.1 energy transducer TonB [Roseibacterium beibuensis]